MKQSTLILAAGFAILSAYVFFIDLRHPASKGLLGKGTRILSYNPNDIQRLEIDDHQKILRFERTDDHWEMTFPQHDSAEALECGNLAQAVADLRSQADVNKTENLKEYGLSPPSAVVKAALKNGAQIEIRIGNQDPTGRGYYAFFPATGKLSLVSPWFAQYLHRGVSAWRDQSLIHFDPDHVEKLAVQKGNQKLEIAKIDGNWKILDPEKRPAIESKVRNLLVSILSARSNRFASGRERIPQSSPTFEVRVWESGNPNPVRMVIGPKTANGYPARPEGRSSILFLDDAYLKGIDLNPKTYEDSHLIVFKPETITRVETWRGDHQGVFLHQGKGWIAVTSPPVDFPLWKLDLILNDIVALEDFYFKVNVPPITHPQAEVKLFRGSELFADVRIGEKRTQGKSFGYETEILPDGTRAVTKGSFLFTKIP